ncbi:electron transport complex subunit D [Actinobacillus succinogenes]|uniref:Ion-translocating oxidoreductase complex subunit D n=1 Tax=Actinobacillus succinogenes (strain ATCC 55618 / DSM 22257 / CCUG 43843 / 130Z) TaxID=339671 RepID=RNFD_ACTSZ|nr:electron transport complex subunit RsxD [Actinobacillus succinogenes]A6VQ43.1 RecName: Full=Ion-translocating oxidoreductase complex subunit D; AltName: Full=Rnf electron transport complex subunit D [Actinobacillus succinogenes 130Z]ABR75090.1 electron transport complex, RnfABCDGE type, D subunit [Actinobacillus succinogenes 130Z]PHI40508.1 electron transport complex subunit D [Actinobacillus succinogenes]
MFKLTSSPHIHSGKLTARIMLWVIFGMLPALAVQVYYFGFGVLIQICLAVALALILEFAVTKLRKKPSLFYISDFSVILTALILAMAIPPYAPYWVILIGTFCAVILGKHVYGGLGQNLFNPAMVGYVVLLISFPVQMTGWMPPISLLHEPPTFGDSLGLIFSGVTGDGFSLSQLVSSIDGLSSATPLDSAKTWLKSGGSATDLLNQPIFLPGLEAGLGWLQVNLAFFIGGLFLIWKKAIHWQTPVAILLSLGIFCGLFDLFGNAQAVGFFAQLFSGAMMFGAFFIATDPVTAPVTPKGKWVFGILIGLLICLIRQFGNYPDGVAFAVLLANICVPLIDQYTRPRVAGYGLNGRN